MVTLRTATACIYFSFHAPDLVTSNRENGMLFLCVMSTGVQKDNQIVNMVLNVHRNHEAYGGGGGGDYIPIATLSPPE